MLLFEHHVYNHHTDPYRYGGIGNIESGPMIMVPVHVYKIYNLAEPYPVDHISHGAAKNKSEGSREKCGISLIAVNCIKNHAQGNNGDAYKEWNPERIIDTGKNAERHAPVPDIGKMEKILDDLYRLIETHRPVHVDLYQLINSNDGRRKEKKKYIFILQCLLQLCNIWDKHSSFYH